MRFILPILLLTLCACERISPSVSAAKNAEPELVTVAVEMPMRRSLSSKASLTGEFRPYQQIDLYSRVAGYLRTITVDVGSRVQTGQLIAMLEVPELQAEVEQSAAARKRAESDLTRSQADILRFDAAVVLAKTNIERLQSVNRAEAGLVAQQEIDDVTARLRDAEARVSAARAQVAAASQAVDAAKASEQRTRSVLDFARITAPFSGIVVKRYADPGALIQAGVATNTQALPLVRLADIERLRLAANVPESLAGRLSPGATVEVRVPALQMTFPAKLSRFTGNVQQESRTTEVEIDIANPSRTILPGMVADVSLNIESRHDAIAVPVQSLSNLGGNRFVLIVNDEGKIEERRIETGMEGAAEVEVVAGLKGNEKIITSSRALLRPGMQVEYKVTKASR